MIRRFTPRNRPATGPQSTRNRPLKRRLHEVSCGWTGTRRHHKQTMNSEENAKTYAKTGGILLTIQPFVS